MCKLFEKLKMEHKAELKTCLDKGFETMDLIIEEDIFLSVLFLIDDDYNVDLKAVFCDGFDIIKLIGDWHIEEIIKIVSRRSVPTIC